MRLWFFCAVIVLAGCQLVPALRGGAAGAAGRSHDPNPGDGNGGNRGRNARVKLTLANGLDVILEESRAAPVVAFQAWVRVGSADEPPELAGIAHVFEHMLFKGTAKRGVGQIAREVESAGGDINAWTSFDETVYHLVLASRFFDTGLDILADTLQSSNFDADELERERKVVLEEIKQGHDSPDRVASQLLFATAFPTHPYGRPVIGDETSVRRMTREDLVRFFHSHYVARNVTLVVVGDFDSALAARKIDAAFAGMRAGRPPAARARATESTAPRIVVRAADIKEAHVLLSFHTPSITHEDVPALDLLTVALGQGDSSRLNLEVVRNRQLTTSAYAYMFTPRDAGLMVVGASMPPGRIDEAARALLEETLRLTREEIAPDELAKARSNLESDLVYDKETVQGYARKLGFFAAIAGDVGYEDRYFHRLRQLGPADLRRVAEKYLRLPALTLTALIPEAKEARRAERAARTEARLRAVAAAAGARIVRRYAAASSRAAVDDVVRLALPSGMRILVLRDTTVPTVAIRGVWQGGLRYEDARSNGIANMIAALLVRGTKSRTAEQLMTEVEGMAGGIGGSVGRNSLSLHAELLSRHWERGLEIFADCVRNPAFSDDEIEKERRIVLDDIRAQEDNLGQAAFRLFHATFWKKHPYRLDVLGTRESVSTLTRRRLLDHYRRHYSPGGLTVAIVGDVDTARLVAKLQALFADVPARAAPEGAPVLPEERPRTDAAEAFEFLPRQQAHVVLGYPGTTLTSPDRFTFDLLAQVLSGQGGRLFAELREKRALAYRVSAFSVEGVEPGYFAVYLACSPENLEEAVAGIRDELRKIVDQGVTTAEVERARRYLIGSHAIGLQRRSAVAAAMAFGELYGQGWQEYRRYADHVGRVTADDVVRVARAALDRRREVLAVVKPEEATPAAARRLAR